MMILSSALVVGCFGAKWGGAKWGPWAGDNTLPTHRPVFGPDEAPPEYPPSDAGRLRKPKPKPLIQRPSWEALDVPAGPPGPAGSGFKFHHMRSHDTAVRDMVRFGAALCYTRGATNEWDWKAPNARWNDPKYEKINKNANITEMHNFGSSFVHNYMRKAGVTSMEKSIDTCLHDQARMSDVQFSECIERVVMPVHNWVNRGELEIIIAKENYDDADDVRKHWTDFTSMFQQQIRQVYQHRGLPSKKRMKSAVRFRQGGQESNETFMSQRDADAAAEVAAKPFYILHDTVDDEQRAKFGRLAALMYLSRGLCDYYTNEDSPLDRIKPVFQIVEPKLTGKTDEDKKEHAKKHAEWVRVRNFQEIEETKDCWLNSNRRASRLTPASRAAMEEIKELGNLLAHQRSQKQGVDLSEYSFWIAHLDKKISAIKQSNFVGGEVLIRGNVTDPIQSCLDLIGRLKEHPSYQLLRPYKISVFGRFERVSIIKDQDGAAAGSEGEPQIKMKARKGEKPVWEVMIDGTKTNIKVLQENMKPLEPGKIRHLFVEDFIPSLINDDVDYSNVQNVHSWYPRSNKWHLGRYKIKK